MRGLFRIIVSVVSIATSLLLEIAAAVLLYIFLIRLDSAAFEQLAAEVSAVLRAASAQVGVEIEPLQNAPADAVSLLALGLVVSAAIRLLSRLAGAAFPSDEQVR